MPRCLMAKKWKSYPWPEEKQKLEPIPISKLLMKSHHQHEDDDEEIDVVTIHQGSLNNEGGKSSVFTTSVVQYQNSINCNSASTFASTSTRSGQPVLDQNQNKIEILRSRTENQIANTSSRHQNDVHANPPPPRNYYRASAEDYQITIPTPEVEIKPIPDLINCAAIPTVIQQYNNGNGASTTPQQVRLTSVIHHSSSISAQNNHNSVTITPLNGNNLQNGPSTSSINHSSASPMQPPNSWAPSSPTEGTTAPSPPPHIQHSSQSDTKLVHYSNYSPSSGDISHYSAFLPGENGASSSASYATAINHCASSQTEARPQPTRTRSLAMCFTSTGAALSLPPKKKDIYRPYSLDDRPTVRWRPAEDISAAHAILDLSASPPANSQQAPTPSPPIVPQPLPTPLPSPTDAPISPNNKSQNKTVAYTYEAFFVSDGRSKKRSSSIDVGSGTEQRPKYTCSECGKQYATSSNLSRHKQTHRSLDSQSAKKCITCGKAYVSMPALAMHLLTHKLDHACGICGKLFSRPWLLQGHLRSHTGEKPYGCAHCGKAFADRSNLRAHMQTHSSDKNFECTRCHKTFALKSYLNKHLESACMGESECDDLEPTDQHIPTITQLQ